MKILIGVLVVIVLLVLLVGGSLMGSRNQLVTEKNNVDGAWAQVDVALQRRADLVGGVLDGQAELVVLVLARAEHVTRGPLDRELFFQGLAAVEVAELDRRSSADLAQQAGQVVVLARPRPPARPAGSAPPPPRRSPASSGAGAAARPPSRSPSRPRG